MLCLVTQSCPTLCSPMDCSLIGSSVHGDSPGKNTGVGCHALLQGIFPTQALNLSLPRCRKILYHLSHQGSPFLLAVLLVFTHVVWYSVISHIYINNCISNAAFSHLGFPCGSTDKESACYVGDLCSIPGLRRSPGQGKGYPLQYPGLENTVDCIVHVVTKRQTWPSDFLFTFSHSRTDFCVEISFQLLQINSKEYLLGFMVRVWLVL